MEKAEEGELPESRVEGVDRQPPKSAKAAAPAAAQPGDSHEFQLTRFDQHSFRDAAFNELGVARGPFYFVLDDGTEFCASRILDTLVSVLLLELTDEVGDVKKIRIPYTRIVSCSTVPGRRPHPADEPDWDGGTETVAIRLPDDFAETREIPMPGDIGDTQEVDVQPRKRR